jgi:hypothetical protein
MNTERRALLVQALRDTVEVVSEALPLPDSGPSERGLFARPEELGEAAVREARQSLFPVVFAEVLKRATNLDIGLADC